MYLKGSLQGNSYVKQDLFYFKKKRRKLHSK
jgi:hypothetical protein